MDERTADGGRSAVGGGDALRLDEGRAGAPNGAINGDPDARTRGELIARNDGEIATVVGPEDPRGPKAVGAKASCLGGSLPCLPI